MVYGTSLNKEGRESVEVGSERQLEDKKKGRGDIFTTSLMNWDGLKLK